VEIVDQVTGKRRTIEAEHVLVAGGALASPHLLLASGIRGEGGSGDLMGRYLMRHVNCIVTGVLPRRANPESVFHKMVSIPDFYHGALRGRGNPAGPWGLIQEIHTPGPGILKANTPLGLKTIAARVAPHLVNLICIADEIGQRTNRVHLDESRVDKFGMPGLAVFHRYGRRDRAVIKALAREARRIIRKAGAIPIYTLPVVSFAHALGTCRFGEDPDTSVLDPDCRVWGFENLFVVDASFMPAGGSVNPSLTIAANALRVAEKLLGR
jgi:choline dehydrogenase-like flavoprotein